MECFFNNFVPDSTESTIIIKPIGRTFIDGLSSSYDDTYTPQLQPYLEEQVFKNCINDINNILTNYWPCYCARCLGYSCCLCSIGLSLLLPKTCIVDAEEALQHKLDHFNRTVGKYKGLTIKLVRKCSTSWLEINVEKKEKEASDGILQNENEHTDYESN